MRKRPRRCVRGHVVAVRQERGRFLCEGVFSRAAHSNSKMVESNPSALVAQFSFSTSSSTKLNLGQPKLRKADAACGASPLACSFSTRGSVKVLARGRRSVRASPFASLSMALPFASATISSKAAPSKAPVAPKKKKSLAEILDYAGKKALSGGLPGALAMGLQVLSMMWLR